MAIYQIVKETSFTGTTTYSVEKNGIYVWNSASNDLTQVEDYLHIILTNGEKIKETIKTIEVDENKTD
jgi:hypothetical protein